MDDKALVMLSGGLDSATCLYWAKRKFSDVSAITFNYFGRLEQEKRAAVRLAKGAGVTELIQIDLPFVKEASDFYNGRLKKQDPDALWSSYVPARNLIFYSIAAHYAEYLGAKRMIGGHNLHDVKFFKDASIDYIEKLNALFKEGCLLCNGRAYKILLPLSEMTRKEIIKLAIKLKVPIEQTWSCHREGSVHCGRCYACKQRLDAFSSLGLKDPAFRRS
ncbi:7-cyano-7-deazaguanine synthase [Candidatus Nitrososphaera gargensis]|nr:7-cyano-7-deazaguanine synthase [Candidatus Nitrososphaera gargensis]